MALSRQRGLVCAGPGDRRPPPGAPSRPRGDRARARGREALADAGGAEDAARARGARRRRAVGEVRRPAHPRPRIGDDGRRPAQAALVREPAAPRADPARALARRRARASLPLASGQEREVIAEALVALADRMPRAASAFRRLQPAPARRAVPPREAFSDAGPAWHRRTLSRTVRPSSAVARLASSVPPERHSPSALRHAARKARSSLKGGLHPVSRARRRRSTGSVRPRDASSPTPVPPHAEDGSASSAATSSGARRETPRSGNSKTFSGAPPTAPGRSARQARRRGDRRGRASGAAAASRTAGVGLDTREGLRLRSPPRR